MPRPGELWSYTLDIGQSRSLKPWTNLLIVNACLGHQLPPGEAARGSFVLTVAGRQTPVASFAKETWNQVPLNLQLDANVEYVLSAVGPYPIDLVGYYDIRCAEGGQALMIPTNAKSTPRSTTTTRFNGGDAQSDEPQVPKKRKAKSDRDEGDFEDAPGPTRRRKTAIVNDHEGFEYEEEG